MKKIFTLLLILQSCLLYAQDDLLKMLADSVPKKSQCVIATFKSTRIISAHSNETLKHRNLDFRIAHRFGNIGAQSGGGVHSLYGFYNSSDILISFEYGITDRLMVGVSTSKRNEAYQGFGKLKALIQTTDNKIPVSVTLFTNAVITIEKATDDRYQNQSHRLSYCSQVIIARKFSKKLSFEILPTLVHRNYVFYKDDENDLYSIGGAGRWKFSRSSAIITEYFYTFSKFRSNNTVTPFYAPLSIGYEVETGGHVFSLMFSNSSGILENDFIPNTTDSWLKGGFKFSFNISRVFVIGGNSSNK